MAALSKSDKKKAQTAKDMRELSVDELKKRLAAMGEDLMNARFAHATAALERTSDLKLFRRQIARMRTILKQKEQGI